MSEQPIVQPVKKSEASPAVRTLLDDIQDTMGTPWPPTNWRAHAMYPAAASLFWERIRPAVATEEFLRAALAITERAYSEAVNWYQPSYRPDVPEEARQQIQWELDAFDFGNPQLMIQEAALHRALEGQVAGRLAPMEWRRYPSPYRRPEIRMIEEAEAPPEVRLIYEDIKRTLDLPIVNADYQAMAKWPAFLQQAWGDVKRWREREEYQRTKQALALMAQEAAQRLSPPLRIAAHELEAALPDAEERENLRRMVALFDQLLSGLTLNVALFRVGAAAGEMIPAPQVKQVPER